MSCVECKSCGCWAEPDAEGAYDKDSPFGWKCAECLAKDCEKADEHGYRVKDEEEARERAYREHGDRMAAIAEDQA